ncbi:uroporphyrinogen-III C-methyltransferase [Desertibacillus haloalkaliphilus]|uniref:uroporphyrinogen-III C-methyltransferase n=1 Tax=Desertibacillus haloalkaliphilus TaxID=1328930 RepID=UPI001C276494|nr:uroporphyrinogen-III C-methyltransferase [Desertibacillus haloalkaliphilus]MBU8907819.1 uroporphyrinogen-III C-methyltransferase [Desertibacillus haloalkaliphilus]
MKTTGKVYLVGAGPGDPKLLTIRGLECIQEADVIIYDRLASSSLLEHAKSKAELIYCGKLPKHHTLRQEQINEILVQKASAGLVVTRLKGGDPCVFGRVGEEAEHLAFHGIDFEIVPGISAGIAAPTYAGIPVTHREYGSSFAVVTGHLQQEQEDTRRWGALATGVDTIVFYMGVNNLSYICRRLIEHGRDSKTPVAMIEWGTTEKQRTITGTLETIEEVSASFAITHPAIILVGEVVRLREKLQWFQERNTLMQG